MTAAHTELPTPYVLSTLRLPPGKKFFIAGCAISQLYNRLRTPPFLIPFLGLPKIRSCHVRRPPTAEFIVPWLTSIPMGASFAFALAQAISLSIVRSSGLSPPRNLSDLLDSTIPSGRGAQLVYIDDHNSIDTSAGGVNLARDTVAAELEGAGLPVEQSKKIESVK